MSRLHNEDVEPSLGVFDMAESHVVYSKNIMLLDAFFEPNAKLAPKVVMNDRF